jgi:hypothetical protein
MTIESTDVRARILVQYASLCLLKLPCASVPYNYPCLCSAPTDGLAVLLCATSVTGTLLPRCRPLLEAATGS